MTQEDLKLVDMTPDEDLPLRILRAYRVNCDTRWETSGLNEAEARIYVIMNEHQKERAKILDKAIRILEEAPHADLEST
jgi:hypothetical protein